MCSAFRRRKIRQRLTFSNPLELHTRRRPQRGSCLNFQLHMQLNSPRTLSNCADNARNLQKNQLLVICKGKAARVCWETKHDVVQRQDSNIRPWITEWPALCT